LLQELPFHDDPVPVHACTPESEIVPSRWCAVEGLLTVKFTVDEAPGYSVLAAVPVTVNEALAPTVAVPEPVPVAVKYA
jgi:hypothetical protein